MQDGVVLGVVVIVTFLVNSCLHESKLWRQLHVKIITNAYSVNIKINK